MFKIFAERWYAVLLLLAGLAAYSSACTIDLEVVKGEKEVYATGDTLVVSLDLTYSHKVCTITLKDTQYKTKGCKILGGTKWAESKNGTVHTRKLKVLITGTEEKEASLTIIRTCKNTGGMGQITFKTAE